MEGFASPDTTRCAPDGFGEGVFCIYAVAFAAAYFDLSMTPIMWLP